MNSTLKNPRQQCSKRLTPLTEDQREQLPRDWRLHGKPIGFYFSAHMQCYRLTIRRHVDRIYVFEEGRIIEQGTFEELLENPKGSFSQQYQLQQHAAR